MNTRQNEVYKRFKNSKIIPVVLYENTTYLSVNRALHPYSLSHLALRFLTL